MKSIFSILLLGLVSGCSVTGKLKDISSGQTGCAPSDVKISEENVGMFNSTPTWMAECEGTKYVCSAAGKQFTCKEKVKK